MRTEVTSKNSTLKCLLYLIVPSLLMLAISIPGLMQLKPNGNPRIFFNSDNTIYQKVVALEKEFTALDSIMFVLEMKEGDIFDRETLNAIYDLTNTLWTKSHVQKSESITSFKRTQTIDDTLETSALFDPELDQDMNEIREYVQSEERLLNSVVGKDLDVTAAIAYLKVDKTDYKQVEEINDWAEQLKTEFSANHPNIKVHLAGSVIYSEAMNQATMDEVSTKLPLIFLLMVIILYVLLRNSWLIMATVYIILLANIITLSIAGWAKIPITPIIAFVPISLFAIVLADAVHLISSYIHHANLGHNKESAINQSMKENFQAMLITSVTTAVGFLCLNVSDSPPYRHLGNLSAAGSMIAFLLTVIWLPKWITLFPFKKRSESQAISIFAIAIKKPYISMAVVTLGVALAATQLNKNYLDERIESYFDDTWDIKQTNDLINNKLTGVHRMEYRVAEFEGNAITSPVYLEALSNFREWALKQPRVAHVSSFDLVIKTVNQQMNDGKPEFYSIPDNPQLSSQYFLLYEMSLPFGSTMEDIVNFSKTATRVNVVFYSSSSQEILQFERAAQEWIHANWPEPMWTEATSLEAAFSVLNMENSISLIQGTGIGFILIAIILCITLKSIKLGLLSIVSNMVPAVTAFGIWGMVDGQVGLAISIVTVITLGIVVDDTIHLLTKYQRARTLMGYNSKDAALYALNTTGKALVTTTLVLCICYGILSFSHFKPNSDLGFLSATTLGIALIIDLFLFLPFIMLLGKSEDSTNSVSPTEPKNQSDVSVSPQ